MTVDKIYQRSLTGTPAEIKEYKQKAAAQGVFYDEHNVRFVIPNYHGDDMQNQINYEATTELLFQTQTTSGHSLALEDLSLPEPVHGAYPIPSDVLRYRYLNNPGKLYHDLHHSNSTCSSCWITMFLESEEANDAIDERYLGDFITPRDLMAFVDSFANQQKDYGVQLAFQARAMELDEREQRLNEWEAELTKREQALH